MEEYSTLQWVNCIIKVLYNCNGGMALKVKEGVIESQRVVSWD